MEHIKGRQGLRRQTKARSRCFSSSCVVRGENCSQEISNYLGNSRTRKCDVFSSCCSPNSKAKVNLPSCTVRYFLGRAPQVGGASTATCGRTEKVNNPRDLGSTSTQYIYPPVKTYSGRNVSRFSLSSSDTKLTRLQRCAKKRTEVIVKLQWRTRNV